MDTPMPGSERPPAIVIAGDLRINFVAGEVTVAGTKLHLEPREYQALAILGLSAVLYPRRPVHKDWFLEIFHPKKDRLDTRAIEVFISKVRRKLSGVSGGREYIETLWGRGYRLVDSVEIRQQ